MGFNWDPAEEAASYAQANARDALSRVGKLEKKLHDFICLFCENKDQNGKCAVSFCYDNSNSQFKMREEP